MNNIYSSFFVLALSLLSVGCGPGISDFSEKLGNGYYYHRTSSMDKYIAPKVWNKTATPMIPSKVIRYKKKDGYVAAKREIVEIGSSGSRVGSGNFDFWILDTSKPKVFGPMDKYEFDIQIAKLGLSEKLALD